MNYYKAHIQYDGTNYFGFQWQKGIPTIQNDLNRALNFLIGGKVTTMSASRTDSGVHAIEQIVKITSEREINCESFMVDLNEILPRQIKCLRIIPCESSFRPNLGNISKEYRYLFTNTHRSSCEDQMFIANNPFTLDLDLMKNCAEMIVGAHSFHNFRSAGSNVKSTVRIISKCEISTIDPQTIFSETSLFPVPRDLNECYQLTIVGNGFLKQMVRHLMSALWLVGKKNITPEDFSLLLKGPEKPKRLWKVASPRGLFLYQIKYKEDA